MKKLLCIIIPLLSFYAAPTLSDYKLVSVSQKSFILLDNNQNVLIKIKPIGFTQNWKYFGARPEKQSSNNGSTTYTYSLNSGSIFWDITAKQEEGGITLLSSIYAKKDLPIKYVSLSIDFIDKKNIIYINESSLEETDHLELPLSIKNSTDINTLDVIGDDDEPITSFTFSPAINIHHHGNSRLKFAENELIAGKKTTHKIHIKTKKKLTFYTNPSKLPSAEPHTNWFAFTPKNKYKKSVLNISNWDHTRIKKEWGTNTTFRYTAPKKKEAIKRTKFFKNYGINSVRLHKLANPGWRGLGSKESASKYNPQSLKRFDYWLSTLKESNINYGFSPIWLLMVFEGDRERLLAYDEIVAKSPNLPITTGLVWFAKDVQDIHIETLTNLLNHKNPYTKLRYADDPSLTYIEIQNEENVFFYTFLGNIKKMPTYHKALAKEFSNWLIKKYKNHSGLISAWGASAIDTFKNEVGYTGELLEKHNITPVLTPWFYDNNNNKIRGRRLQDTAKFLLQKQNEYYARAIQAIRATGYKGKIITGNWQAGEKGAHFLNLLSDTQGDIIDRHNYTGGAVGNPGHVMYSGFSLKNHSMLDDPGSGLLSTGMQQVSGRPFMFSEWLSVIPTEWAAADTALIAAYGFGLQGWDMSYHFSSDGQGFTPTLANGDNKFNNLTPVGIGLFPILSRMVLREDIKEAEPLAIRRLSKEQAIKNSYDFENTVSQSNDFKSFSGTPHHNALAAGKVLIEFTKEPGKSTLPNWRNNHEIKNPNGSKTITSSTGQLKWTYSDKKHQGFVEVNSKGTQGIIGFHPKKKFTFHDMEITSQSSYSVILATAKAQDKVIANDKQLLLMAIARAHNTDMNITGSIIADIGKAPVILEPVKASIAFKRKQGKVIALDHDGNKTRKQYSFSDGKFELDTARDKTIYYLVEFDG